MTSAGRARRRGPESFDITLTGVRPAVSLAGVLVLPTATTAEVAAASTLAGRLARRSLVVGVDGGWHRAVRAGSAPELYVGDGDSGEIPRSGERKVYPGDKDFGDLAAALAEMRRRRVEALVVAGLLGGRFDHEWVNLLELAKHAPKFGGIAAPTERGLVVLTSRGCSISLGTGRVFSLVVPLGRARVSLTGARWSLRRKIVVPGSRGLSNVARGVVRLTVHEGRAGIVVPRAKS